MIRPASHEKQDFIENHYYLCIFFCKIKKKLKQENKIPIYILVERGY